MYQTTSRATSGGSGNGIGGVNAKQIGLGVSTGSTTVTISTAGAAESTGGAFDLKLSDSQTTNFFIVSDGTNTYFTRAGSFYVDGNGYLCMSSTGYVVQGWQVDATTGEIKKDTVSPLQVMSGAAETSDPEATTKAEVTGILDKEDNNLNSKDGYIMSLGFYDDLGYSYTAKFKITPVSTDTTCNRYHIEMTDLLDSSGEAVRDTTGAVVDCSKLIKMYDSSGTEIKVNDTKNTNGNEYSYDLIYDSNKGTFVTAIAADGTYDSTATNNTPYTSLTLDLSSVLTGYTTTTDKNGIALLDNTGAAAPVKSNFQNIEVEFSDSTNVSNGGKSSMRIMKGDSTGDGTGKKVGAMIGLAVDSSGKIYGSYDNGNTELLGQIVVAQFANASGLEKVGDNCYQTTLNSGDFDGIGREVDADGSSINSGQLEMSNVDLAAQFTDMIITQRGFQANSRVISVSDTLLEELINLKR
jgi:flagellar hook protein FlgE